MLALWPAAALAHAVLVKSVPAQRATLGEPPPRVELCAEKDGPPLLLGTQLSEDFQREPDAAAPLALVELEFNERLEPAYSKASVTNEAGAQVDMRDVAVSAQDPRRLSVSLPALAPGRYGGRCVPGSPPPTSRRLAK